MTETSIKSSEGAVERDHTATREVGMALRIRAWEKRVTQRELGTAIGVGDSTVGRKLRGEVPITVDELMEMARLLEVEPSQLLPRLDSNQQPSGYTSSLVGRAVVVRGWDGLPDYSGSIIDVDENLDRDLVVAVMAAVDGGCSWIRLDVERLVPLELAELAA